MLKIICMLVAIVAPCWIAEAALPRICWTRKAKHSNDGMQSATTREKRPPINIVLANAYLDSIIYEGPPEYSKELLQV
jgi:hypothetical protein